MFGILNRFGIYNTLIVLFVIKCVLQWSYIVIVNDVLLCWIESSKMLHLKIVNNLGPTTEFQDLFERKKWWTIFKTELQKRDISYSHRKNRFSCVYSIESQMRSSLVDELIESGFIQSSCLSNGPKINIDCLLSSEWLFVAGRSTRNYDVSRAVSGSLPRCYRLCRLRDEQSSSTECGISLCAHYLSSIYEDRLILRRTFIEF